MVTIGFGIVSQFDFINGSVTRSVIEQAGELNIVIYRIRVGPNTTTRRKFKYRIQR